DVVVIQIVDRGAPLGHRLAVVDLQRLQAQVQHPLGLVLELGDVADDVLVQAAARGRAGVVGVGPSVGVVAQRIDGLFLSQRLGVDRAGGLFRGDGHASSFRSREPPGAESRRVVLLLWAAGSGGLASPSSGARADGTPSGTWVVHTESPLAMVANCWMCVP